MKLARKQDSGTHGERGSALIIVLGAVAVMALLAVHITTWSEVMAKEAKTDTEMSLFTYAAESATEHALWMHLVDRRDYTSRNLLTPPSQTLGEESRERWMADARPHELHVNGLPLRVTIKDAGGGFNIATFDGVGAMRRRLLLHEEDFDRIRTIETFSNCLFDYIDRGDGDAARLNGMERPEFQRLGLTGLPRNGPIQFREELFWLPAAAEVAHVIEPGVKPGDFMDFFIDPHTVKNVRQQPKPSFFSSSATMLRYLAGLTQEQLDDVLANRRACIAGDEILFASLEADVIAKLKQHFSFNESGIITIETTTGSSGDEMQLKHKDTGYARPPVRKF